MKIKICGITNPDDAAAAIDAGADLLGLVFRSGTPRALDTEASGWIREIDGAETVGVFLDQDLDEVVRIRDRFGLDWVQLHGDEPDSYLDELGPRVIRRVRVGPEIDWLEVARLAERCLPLFDPGAGDGVAWAWQVLADRPSAISFGLAGGLNPENVGEAIRSVEPYMVDVSSGVESAPGIKDHDKIRAFISAAREASPTR